MERDTRRLDSAWSLSAELLAAKVLVWVARFGREAELRPEAHMYFFDRYWRLAHIHRAKGRSAKADRLERKAREHYDPGGGPPYAAAMAMPRPRRFIATDAVSRTRMDGSDDAA